MYVFLDNRTEEEDRTYADRRAKDITEHQQHNYNFLSKYLLYAKAIQPVFTHESRAMLKEFWITLRKDKKLGVGNRTLEGIFRIAEATAKLRLKTVIDASIANEVMESFKIMQLQQGQFVKIADDPRTVAVDAMIERVRFIQTPIAFGELVKQICIEYPFVNNWLFGGIYVNNNDNDDFLSASTSNNRKYRELYNRFFQRIQQPGSKIVMRSIKPLVVVWQTC